MQTNLELFKQYNWTETEWKMFFFNLTSKNYDSPKVIWNDEMKEELEISLKNEVENFN